MIDYTPEQIDELRAKYGIPENFVPVASAPGVLAWGVPVEKIKISEERRSRVEGALAETLRLLEKAQSYYALQHQDRALIEFYEAHIEKLRSMA